MSDDMRDLVEKLLAQGMGREEIHEFLQGMGKEEDPVQTGPLSQGKPSTHESGGLTLTTGTGLVTAAVVPDEHMLTIDPTLLAQWPPPQDIPAIRGVIDQAQIGNLVEQLKQMEGIHDVQIDTRPDGTAHVNVQASFPQPVADMIVSLTPAIPAPGPIKAKWLKPRKESAEHPFTLGPLTHIVHDSVMVDVTVPPSLRIVEALSQRPGLAWEVLQSLKVLKLIGPWKVTNGGFEDAEEDFIEREDIHGVVVAYVSRTQDERFHATLHEEEEDAVTRGERFDTFEEAMAWADGELEREGYLLA